MSGAVSIGWFEGVMKEWSMFLSIIFIFFIFFLITYITGKVNSESDFHQNSFEKMTNAKRE